MSTISTIEESFIESERRFMAQVDAIAEKYCNVAEDKDDEVDLDTLEWETDNGFINDRASKPTSVWFSVLDDSGGGSDEEEDDYVTEEEYECSDSEERITPTKPSRRIRVELVDVVLDLIESEMQSQSEQKESKPRPTHLKTKESIESKHHHVGPLSRAQPQAKKRRIALSPVSSPPDNIFTRQRHDYPPHHRYMSSTASDRRHSDNQSCRTKLTGLNLSKPSYEWTPTSSNPFDTALFQAARRSTSSGVQSNSDSYSAESPNSNEYNNTSLSAANHSPSDVDCSDGDESSPHDIYYRENHVGKHCVPKYHDSSNYREPTQQRYGAHETGMPRGSDYAGYHDYVREESQYNDWDKDTGFSELTESSSSYLMDNQEHTFADNDKNYAIVRSKESRPRNIDHVTSTFGQDFTNPCYSRFDKRKPQSHSQSRYPSHRARHVQINKASDDERYIDKDNYRHKSYGSSYSDVHGDYKSSHSERYSSRQKERVFGNHFTTDRNVHRHVQSPETWGRREYTQNSADPSNVSLITYQRRPFQSGKRLSQSGDMPLQSTGRPVLSECRASQSADRQIQSGGRQSQSGVRPSKAEDRPSRLGDRLPESGGRQPQWGERPSKSLERLAQSGGGHSQSRSGQRSHFEDAPFSHTKYDISSEDWRHGKSSYGGPTDYQSPQPRMEPINRYFQNVDDDHFESNDFIHHQKHSRELKAGCYGYGKNGATYNDFSSDVSSSYHTGYLDDSVGMVSSRKPSHSRIAELTGRSASSSLDSSTQQSSEDDQSNIPRQTHRSLYDEYVKKKSDMQKSRENSHSLSARYHSPGSSRDQSPNVSENKTSGSHRHRPQPRSHSRDTESMLSQTTDPLVLLPLSPRRPRSTSRGRTKKSVRGKSGDGRSTSSVRSSSASSQKSGKGCVGLVDQDRDTSHTRIAPSSSPVRDTISKSCYDTEGFRIPDLSMSPRFRTQSRCPDHRTQSANSSPSRRAATPTGHLVNSPSTAISQRISSIHLTSPGKCRRSLSVGGVNRNRSSTPAATDMSLLTADDDHLDSASVMQSSVVNPHFSRRYNSVFNPMHTAKMKTKGSKPN